MYRVSDGLLVNLAMVKEGYGVTADDAPASLKSTLSAAEGEAIVEQRGLWSPATHDAAERDAAAALVQKAARRREEPAKGVQKQIDEQVAMQQIEAWVMLQRRMVLRMQAEIESYEAAMDRKRRTPIVPELDPGPAAGAFALLVCVLLMLADRRRTHSARRSPAGGASG